MGIKKNCFVIMPFSPTESCSDWTNIFENLIKPAVRGMGFSYNCERSTIDGGPFIKGILESLYRADLVIADITDRNPNVFYELGVRHTLRNRTIIITQNENHLPSDLAGYGVVLYEPSLKGLPKFKADLKRIVGKIHKYPDRSDNPVSDYIKKRNYLIFDYERDNILRRLGSLHAELFDNATTIIKNKTYYNDSKYPLFGSFTKCAEDILTSQYIDVSIEMHALLKESILHLQKVDYYAKLLSGQPLELREAHRSIYFHHMDASLACIFRVKEEVQNLIKDISNNNYRLEKKEPIMRSVAWESSQEEIEKWMEELKEKAQKEETETNANKT
jgi:hypothetical protein